MRQHVTPSQTVGPFFRIGLSWADGPYAVAPGTPGGLWIRGLLLDGRGEPVEDGLVETWQADPSGGFGHALASDPTPSGRTPTVAGFRGFARSETDGEGRYGIYTLKPGAIQSGVGRLEAPHLDVSVFARGLLKRVVTRIYFDDEADANAGDAVLSGLASDADRNTLIARATEDGYRFDIRLQGDSETVFFDV